MRYDITLSPLAPRHQAAPDGKRLHIPSHDTFAEIFSRLDPREFEAFALFCDGKPFVNVSPYTIINSTFDDQKITFGDNTPDIKFQTGMNIFRLAQLQKQNEKIFHCLFIRARKHWWIRFLLVPHDQPQFIILN